MKNVAIKGPIKDFNMSLSSFFSTLEANGMNNTFKA